MKRIYKCLSLFLACVLGSALVSCVTEDFDDYDYEGLDGESSVSFELQGLPLQSALTRTAGDAIREVDKIYILFYTAGTTKDEGTTMGDANYEFAYAFTNDDDCANEVFAKGFRIISKEDKSRLSEDESRPFETTEFKPENDNEWKGVAESKTQHVTTSEVQVKRGQYAVYVVANVDDFSNVDFKKDDIATVGDLRSYQLNWNVGNIAANDAMFGFFTEAGSPQYDVINKEAPLIRISEKATTLHAWVKRAVSKVTVAFDGSGLYDNVYVWINSVQIHDIPATCKLGANNTPESNDKLIENGELLKFYETETQKQKVTEANYRNLRGNAITAGSPLWPRMKTGEDPSAYLKRVHGESTDALYFFENMQGKGEMTLCPGGCDQKGTYKPQTDGIKPGIPDDYSNNDIQKDNKPYGSYIEVEAYYENQGNLEVTHGIITYRFMLGKDIFTDFDAERNNHYKLTMCFKNNANDVDWHIAYDESPGIYVPEEYFISYDYSTATMLPVRVSMGEGEVLQDLKVEIIENNWKPYIAGDENSNPKEAPGEGYLYYPGQVMIGNVEYKIIATDPDTETKCYEVNENGKIIVDGVEKESGNIVNGICNGFLQLRKSPDEDRFEIGSGVTRDKTFNHYYWYYRDKKTTATDLPIPDNNEYLNSLGVRTYSITASNNNDDGFEGKYTATKNNNDHSVSFEIPLYTRPLKCITETSYSGANPYYSYMRKARLRYTATIKESDGGTRQVVTYNTVFQRPRIESATGVWRDYNNNDAFRVELAYRDKGEFDDGDIHFEKFTSIGPWSAIVRTGGTSGFISIDSSNAGYTGNKSLAGKTNTEIDFWIHFNTTDAPAQNGTPRCAIIEIKYHNNSCTHLIFVRQGYAPIQMVTEGAYWHTFNIYSYESEDNNVTSVNETNSPCEEGSMFRPFNITKPISESNQRKFGFNVTPEGEFNIANQDAIIWDKIQTHDPSKDKNLLFGKGEGVFKVSNKTGLSTKDAVVSRAEDWESFLNKDDIQVSYGVLYADGATSCALGDKAADIAFHHTHTGDGRSISGMRGCFVYNTNNGRCLFFPIGYTGYGRRQSDGKLRYAGASALLQFNTSPLLYNLFFNQGGIYWFGQSGSVRSVEANSFDINYKTYDFNDFRTSNISTGAAYIRLVQTEAPE